MSIKSVQNYHNPVAEPNGTRVKETYGTASGGSEQHGYLYQPCTFGGFCHRCHSFFVASVLLATQFNNSQCLKTYIEYLYSLAFSFARLFAQRCPLQLQRKARNNVPLQGIHGVWRRKISKRVPKTFSICNHVAIKWEHDIAAMALTTWAAAPSSPIGMNARSLCTPTWLV